MLTRIGVFLFWLMHFLPFRILVWIGNTFGLLLYLLAAERRRVAAINLHMCFPDMSDTRRARLLRDHFKMFGRGVIERTILWWSSRARICSLIRVEGIEHFDAVKGKPVILLTPHFVGMDVGGSWISQQVDAISVYSTQKNRYLSEMLFNAYVSATSASTPVSKGCVPSSRHCARAVPFSICLIRIRQLRMGPSFHFSVCQQQRLPPCLVWLQ
jgi:KDO2-lipid IV(A) lauroyltransferase